MTPEQYNERGFNFSQHIEQAKIDRAERDVKQAYITPIVGENTESDEAKDAIANLSFLLLLQRSMFETRAGAKVKLTTQSNTPYGWDALTQQAHVCEMKLDALRATEGANVSAEVHDICRISFKSNYFSV